MSLFMVVTELLLFVAVNPVVYADTEISRIISSNTTWTKAGSPYSLTGNLLVDNGVTLTIEAGVIINLNSFYITVNGTLQAREQKQTKSLSTMEKSRLTTTLPTAMNKQLLLN